jgi:glutamate synthase (ferredoxin)
MTTKDNQYPLYDPRFEHDACGIGFVADLSGRATHKVLDDGLKCLERLAHRGAFDADGKSGDGAGILCSIPHTLINRELERIGQRAHRPGDIALGMLFLPREPALNAQARSLIADELVRNNLEALTWRTVVHEPNVLGKRAFETLPDIQQVLIERPDAIRSELEFDQFLFLVRSRIQNRIFRETGAKRHASLPGFYIPSMSCRTVCYKALVSAPQLRRFYLDLNDPDFKVSHILFHQRYSTNTLPTWERAQPFRFMCHNGEINTLQGNINWMRAREPMLESLIWGGEIDDLKPIIDEASSDSGMFDNVLELLNLGGRDITHSIKMMVPQAWEKDPDMPPAVKGFFRYHAALMEPWDGPASIAFTDGVRVGMTLDRNGLRPARYIHTSDGIVYAGSEIGALDVEPEKIIASGKLGPGTMVCADLQSRRLLTNDVILKELATRKPYREVAARQRVRLEEVANLTLEQPAVNSEALLVKQASFGWTSEELTVVIKTMFEDGTEPVGSMGDDTPHAVLSPKPRSLFNYFKQRFAEVTNPPIDHLREDQVMSLRVLLGARGNVLDETEDVAHLVRLNSPILRNEELKALQTLDDSAFQSVALDATFNVADGARGFEKAVHRLCEDAERAVRVGASILIISDRKTGPQRAAIPAALAVGAVHFHLIREKLRMNASIVVESGEARETHHFAVLIGYGAAAVNPYLALDTAREAVQRGRIRDKTVDENEVVKHYIKAAEKGVLKIMSKMGIATVDGYCGAQVFEAMGLHADVVEECFTGTPSRVGGVCYDEIANAVLQWHGNAYPQHEGDPTPVKLDHPGFYKERAGGEAHGYSQRAVHALQKAVRIEGIIEYTGEEELVTGVARTRVKSFRTNGHFHEGYRIYKEEFAAPYYTPEQPIEPRDLLEIKSDRAPVPLDEVESMISIARRFSTAAMSFGAISQEAHQTLAIAMTRLGGLSNSGEGGEDMERLSDELNSGIKQVASGRFGVTPVYLMSASELQIKMAQGSKPGEGGQIPGHKVTDAIARVRHTVPGVALISPPPHHDIYSIEDLSQLIYDLKQINADARVSVKLVSQAGVGTIAAGVAKALADVVQISGHNGGTGASPLSSIKNAGLPWELGLAETQQTLLSNNLRGRIRVRADGGLRTGKDVLVAALLGADEFSFGTTTLIAEGCIMARVCHLNTCPTGVATQKPELRAKFEGQPEHVMAFLLYVAQDVREHLAQMGYRSLDEVIGRADLLAQRKKVGADQARNLAGVVDLQALLAPPPAGLATHQVERAPQPPRNALNEQIVRDARPAIDDGWKVQLHYSIRNQDRSIGARLSGEITRKYMDEGLPPGAIEIDFRGYAGQSFGAFNTNGMRLHLVGAANDYVGKGIRGGEISIRPFPETTYEWSENHIMGNTALYGATGGALFAAGCAGERFAVRNSGACGVVEGVGDNALEYMTGGVVVVLGATGRNFAAGMTGGMAFVYDPDGTFVNHCNTELVDVDRLTNPGMKKLVKSLLRRHYELTNSPRARDLLKNWEEAALSFRRVLPKDRVAQIEAINEFSDFEST